MTTYTQEPAGSTAGYPGAHFCSSCGPNEPLPQYPDEPMSDYGVHLETADEKGGLMASILADLSKEIEDHISKLDEELRDLSVKMWDHPEVAWTEHKTHDLFVKYLQGKEGWKVTPHAHGLETAYRAEFEHRSDGLASDKVPVIGFNSEMDALPGIGHACGHNLIAIAGVAASLSVAVALVKNNVSGRVILLGTPAEEAYGGKIDLLKRGAYKDMDACLMLHPAPMDSVGKMIAVMHIYVHYTGQTAHAGAAPWEGINAQDAGVLAYTNISALRQQIKPDCRVHGIIQGDNWAPNVSTSRDVIAAERTHHFCLNFTSHRSCRAAVTSLTTCVLLASRRMRPCQNVSSSASRQPQRRRVVQ